MARRLALLITILSLTLLAGGAQQTHAVLAQALATTPAGEAPRPIASPIPVVASSSPTARQYAGSAFNAATGTTVLFGGQDSRGNFLSDTWTWNGSVWTAVCGTQGTPSCGPVARIRMGMTYDTAANTVVLFGGEGTPCTSNGCTTLCDTWTWSGSTWVQQAPSVSPPARFEASMAYDAATSSVVLFGGNSACTSTSCTRLDDTWTWNGTIWAQQTPSSSPPARQDAAMSYDAVHSQVVLFGGCCGFLGDTWTWDGSTWTQQHPNSSPLPRQNAQMASDAATGTTVLFGGYGCPGGICTYLGDSWIWDGTKWALQNPGTSPSARFNGVMTYDAARNAVLLFGGLGGSGLLDDTWSWNGTSWTQLVAATPLTAPAPRTGAGMAFDTATNSVILFGGGVSTYEGLNDTWSWNGSAWSMLSPSTSPPPIVQPAVTYDAAHNALVLYAGSSGTWTFDGTTWLQQHPSISPPVRQNTVLAFDAATNSTILFGGITCPNGVCTRLNDTWSWNGSTWAPQHPGTSPPARDTASMAYDAATSTLVLFGGYVCNGATCAAVNDTWTWDGTNWTQQIPAGSPPARNAASMAYDAATSTVVLFGGCCGSAGNFADTWTWNGATWSQKVPTISPPARNYAGMAYDAAHSQIVLFGGCCPNGRANDTWLWDGSTWVLGGPPLPSAVTGVAPATGPTTGGMVVVISGANLGGVGYSSTVKFGPTAATGVTCGSSICTAISPAGSGTVDIQVTTQGVTSPPTAADRFTYLAPTNPNWVQQHPAISPPARGEPSTAYDAAHGAVVLFGG
ncbi:MAG: Kelch repeat-containing protein [Dehalococcoidia bacterium]